MVVCRTALIADFCDWEASEVVVSLVCLRFGVGRTSFLRRLGDHLQSESTLFLTDVSLPR